VTGALVAAAAKSSHTPVQWWTLAWIAGAALAATVIIAVIVLVSRRPKSMEDGMAEFSRSLQAVAPTVRGVGRSGGSEIQPVATRADGRATRRRSGSDV